MDSAPASRQPNALHLAWPAAVCALAGFAMFQLYGNHGRGYINTASLFYWWGYQMNPSGETQHGWLILGLSAWLFWRNLRIAAQEDPQSAIRNPQFDRAAAMALIGGLALHALGFAAQQSRVSIVALLI